MIESGQSRKTASDIFHVKIYPVFFISTARYTLRNKPLSKILTKTDLAKNEILLVTRLTEGVTVTILDKIATTAVILLTKTDTILDHPNSDSKAVFNKIQVQQSKLYQLISSNITLEGPN